MNPCACPCASLDRPAPNAEGNLDGYQRKKYLSKIVFTYILGYQVDVGHMEAVGLIASSKYSEKQIGYLALTLLMHENSDFVRLVVNSIRKDLDTHDEVTNCLALHAIANLGGKEMAESLAEDVHRLLISPTSKSFVKKKAALTLLRLYRKFPECVNTKEWGLRIVSIMDDDNLVSCCSRDSQVQAHDRSLRLASRRLVLTHSHLAFPGRRPLCDESSHHPRPRQPRGHGRLLSESSRPLTQNRGQAALLVGLRVLQGPDTMAAGQTAQAPPILPSLRYVRLLPFWGKTSWTASGALCPPTRRRLCAFFLNWIPQTIQRFD